MPTHGVVGVPIVPGNDNYRCLLKASFCSTQQRHQTVHILRRELFQLPQQFKRGGCLRLRQPHRETTTDLSAMGFRIDR
ncbi:MAG: hypothetical protein QOK44_2810, partial [Betaproteobacteria bacterium]|nr:hypothetical protein [Betaproteobacteria bacterium]